MGFMKSLFERPKDIGFRFGFIAILLIMITAVFPAFISIGYDDPQISSFQSMFLTGMVGTLFFSVLLRQKTKTRHEDGIVFSPQNINKQFAVLMIGIIAGIVMVVLNGLVYGTANIVLGSVWGEINTKALYLCLLAGVSEELFFRGFIGTFMRIVSPNLIFAIVPSAAIFALFHYFAYWELSAFIVLFVLGIILGLIHELTNDIGASMLAHVVNNTFVMMPVVLAVLTDNVLIIVSVVVLFVFIVFARGTFRRR